MIKDHYRLLIIFRSAATIICSINKSMILLQTRYIHVRRIHRVDNEATTGAPWRKRYPDISPWTFHTRTFPPERNIGSHYLGTQLLTTFKSMIITVDQLLVHINQANIIVYHPRIKYNRHILKSHLWVDLGNHMEKMTYGAGHIWVCSWSQFVQL